MRTAVVLLYYVLMCPLPVCQPCPDPRHATVPATLHTTEAAELALSALVSCGALDCTVRLQQAKDTLRARSVAAEQDSLISSEQALYWCVFYA